MRASLSAGSWSWSWEKDWVWGQGSLLATIGATEGMQQVVVDHQGSVGLLANRCGQRLAELVTNPWGLDLFSSTQNGERHRYTGHLRDVHLGDRSWDDFDQMHARYYNPNIARFLSVDPGRDNDPGAPQSWNLYAYVRNNPVNLVDPDGRLAILVATKNYEAINTAVKDRLTPVVGPNVANKVADVIAPPKPDAMTMTTAAMGFATPLVMTTTAAKVATPALSAVGKVATKLKEALGLYPQKVGAGGQLQPYSALTGQYVSPAATLGAKTGGAAVSPCGQFAIGFAEGLAKGAITGTNAPAPGTKAEQLGQVLGEIVGTILGRLD